MVFNSALFSICFMVFLGFTDDTLELKWRYKLILPTVASLPLLVAYSGPTAVTIPQPFQALLMQGEHLTTLGRLMDVFVTVDTNAQGSVVELGVLFMLYMGLLSVFCTNAINIYAGINGLECGQAYIIGCSLLFFKLYELQGDSSEISDHQMFSLTLILPFIATSLGLLRHNWFPADVFVGDTYCYFAGMTFAVVGIHGHFSKTLLLLFIPQIANFLYSIPQLFKLLPCPRHRLPRVDPVTKTLYYSAFPCEKHEYRWFGLKTSSDAEECPNMTLICAVLRFTGPLTEKNLCIVLLALQAATSCFAFFVRYYLLENAT
jgi:UDP-N-acetylglucosamine--dolichyl-phosphate N-acetylglucosaminephosphotransferase